MKAFLDLIKKEGHTALYVFNFDETGEREWLLHGKPLELTTEELKELDEQQNTEVQQDIQREETEAGEVHVRRSDVKEVLAMWVKSSQFIDEKHPDKL